MTETFTPGAGRERALRTAFGSFATGVTVVTCRDEKGPLGFTANSFTSVSLDPPLLLWCPAITSPRHDPYVAAHRFSVHVLEADQSDLSERFAIDARDFQGVEWSEGPEGVPQLSRCLTRFDCRHFAAHGAGDHTIVLGLVEQVTHTPGVPLVFALGAYGRFDTNI
ncbi:flavin reductase family protein [Tropicimonas isoalkanivorans]|uniref:NADH-FMN oxidoreductase RutF, flavin reductase (DIM6/NTAB) family n=1 Tax=Tropicimonas isoalkanivorans TaxID=441112 RepID=A0A1I1P698_9RHOB|nr:flavin reductase family protein [Tropicimonas isoalkanivorans]SFD05122.1 NADH-FMN oxidoreductase RutF, flavin reductase (DIM6/NTAB) family [Tropicimonas isoalkanivorans]